MGVFAEPARTLVNPMAEKVAVFSPIKVAKTIPEVAPTKKIGVTMPPLPPKFRVIEVNSGLSMKAYQETFSPARHASIASKSGGFRLAFG